VDSFVVTRVFDKTPLQIFEVVFCRFFVFRMIVVIFMKQYRVLSLFSGAMGMDLGFHATERFQTIAAVENWRAAKETIRKNRENGWFSNLRLIGKSIKSVDAEQFSSPDIDVIIGGPPCQSFSTAGRRRGIDDVRGTLLWDLVRFVNTIRPQVFVMENVVGLSSAQMPDGHSVISHFRSAIHDYHIGTFVMNVMHYGGFQNRRRLITIGCREGKRILPMRLTHGSQRTGFSSLERYQTLRDGIGHLQEVQSDGMNYSEKKASVFRFIPEGGDWRNLPVDIESRVDFGKAVIQKYGFAWRRLSWNKSCPVLLCNPDQTLTSQCHPREIRPLNLLEYAAIQEFPEDWIICGTVAERYRQIGNAVPIRLGRIIGEMVAEHLDTVHSC
jgi:DNA (cytosine-5)-methyltransferase 1